MFLSACHGRILVTATRRRLVASPHGRFAESSRIRKFRIVAWPCDARKRFFRDYDVRAPDHWAGGRAVASGGCTGMGRPRRADPARVADLRRSDRVELGHATPENASSELMTSAHPTTGQV